MPNIRTYEAPSLGLSPSSLGTDATAQAARRIGSEYNEVAEATMRVGEQEGRGIASTIRDVGGVVNDYFTHREISTGATAFAGLQDRLTNQWNDVAKSANPDDPTVAEKFRTEVLEPELEKYRDSFNTEGGQKWAESHIDSLRRGMFEKTASDMSTLAAHAVSVNMEKTANSLSNTAMNNPESVPRLLGQTDTMVSGIIDSSPTLKGAAASKARMELTQKMKENIVKAGAIGAIQRSANPEAEAEKWGAAYPDFISGADLKALSGNARQQIRADRTDRAYSDLLTKKAAEEKSDRAEVGYLQRLYNDDPKVNAQVSTKDIVNDPDLTRTAKERMIQVVNREMKPETAAQESNRNYLGVLQGIRSGEISDVDPIYKARADGKLNRADFNQALKDFTEYKSPQGEALAKDRDEFFKRYAPAIDPSITDANSLNFGHLSALGSQKMYDARKAAMRAEADARAKNQDPHTVYDPSSPNFFGRPENIGKYRASLQDSAAYQAALSGGKPQNLTGAGKDVTGTEVIAIPAGMSPADAMKQYKSGTKVRLPDGRIGTVP